MGVSGGLRRGYPDSRWARRCFILTLVGCVLGADNYPVEKRAGLPWRYKTNAPVFSFLVKCPYRCEEEARRGGAEEQLIQQSPY